MQPKRKLLDSTYALFLLRYLLLVEAKSLPGSMLSLLLETAAFDRSRNILEGGGSCIQMHPLPVSVIYF